MNIPASGYRVRTGAIALAVAGVLFVLYPAIRPFSDENTLPGAHAFASDAWVVSHVTGMLGFIGLAVGLLGLHLALPGPRAARLSFWAVVTGWIGAGLTLTYYGGEVYGLRVIGRQALAEHSTAVLSLADQVRGAPGAVIFATGLVLLAAGAILAAVASWPSAGPRRWGALIVAVGVVTYIPQFFGGQPVRIAHGALLAAGCLCLAAGLWRTRSGMARPPGPAPVSAVETASGSVR